MGATARLCVVLGALLCGWASGASAQEMALTPDVQFPLFDRILTYDKNFTERVGDELVIGVLYQRRFRPSVAARDQVVRAVQELGLDSLSGVPVRFVTLDLDAGGLDRRVQAEDIDYLYVTPLRSPDFDQIVSVCATHQVTTLTGVREYVEDGLGIGLGVRGGRPEIVVNLPAARASGSELSSRLLQVATVYN
jgi:hypothetical protein